MALLVLAVIGLSAGIVLVNQEKRQTERERDRATRAAADLELEDYSHKVDLALSRDPGRQSRTGREPALRLPGETARLGVGFRQATGPSRSPDL